jgi:hypothetical protein
MQGRDDDEDTTYTIWGLRVGRARGHLAGHMKVLTDHPSSDLFGHSSLLIIAGLDNAARVPSTEKMNISFHFVRALSEHFAFTIYI